MTRHLSLRRLTAATRLALVMMLCALVAGAVPGAHHPREAALAGGTSLSPSDQVTRDSADEAITRTTTTVSTRAAVASPDVRSLPSVATAPGDLPTEALDAYVRAAQVIASVRPGCHLSWSVLAAIGQVESDHGRSSGGHLLPDGSTSTPVRGRVLDGSGGTPRVADTDGGQLDGITTWDRAVGPMQFLPSTWIAARVDGDGDGVRSPDDIDDASLAAAVFLCAAGDDLSTARGAQVAIGRYNHTPGYPADVASLAQAYDAGSYESNAWQGVVAATWAIPYGVPAAAEPNPEAARARHLTSVATAPGATPGSPQTAAAASAPSLAPSPSSSSTPTPGASGTPTADASPTDAPSGAPGPSDTPTPSDGGSSSGEPTSDPSPGPSPDPSPGPSSDGPSGPVTTTISGVLQACADGGFCLDGTALDLGELDTPAAADFDGDGTIGTRAAELTALVGTPVKVVVEGSTPGGKVVALDGEDWS